MTIGLGGYRTLLVASLLAVAVAASSSAAQPRTATDSAAVRSLRLVPAHARRFVMGLYDATGRFPQVTGRRDDLRAVNAGLRRALRADQRRYAKNAPIGRRPYRYVPCPGIYSTAISRRLVSASTVVVSAMLPALELFPCGNDGSTWVSMTVEVPSGRRVGLPELFADPPAALRVLARAWKARARQLRGTAWTIVHTWPREYGPRAFGRADFALTVRGLAVGFPQNGPTVRFYEFVRYRILRAYMSPLGRRLVAGVRAPRLDSGGLRGAFPGASPPRRLHRRFRTAGRTPVRCELADHDPHVSTFVRCALVRGSATAIGVELTPRRPVAVCHGTACRQAAPHGGRVLHSGQSISTRRYTCVAIRSDMYCQGSGSGSGFRLGPDGYARLPH